MHQYYQTFFDSLPQIDHIIHKLHENRVINTLLFGNPNYIVLVNSEILMTTISNILSKNRLHGNLM